MSIEDAKRTFLDKVMAYSNSEARVQAEVILDDFIAWSDNTGGRVQFLPTKGAQGQVCFAVPATDQVLWQVYPRMADGAKFDILPRASARYPEDVRKTVRAALADLVAGSAGADVPSVSLFSLSDAGVRRAIKHGLTLLLCMP